MSAILNIIHLDFELFDPASQLYTEALSRQHNAHAQIYSNKIDNWVLWPGIIEQGMPFKGISKSHKKIIRDAKEKGLQFCIIAEDDFKFCSENSWQYFMDNIPDEYDIFLGGLSGGEVNEETKEIIGWSGLFFYAIHSRFFDVFLSADEEKNIDRWLSGVGLESIEKQLGRKPLYKVCYPIIAICKDGFSYNSGTEIQHEKYFRPYKKFQ